MPRFTLAALALVLATIVLAPHAGAGSETAHGSAALIDGGSEGDRLRAGVDIRLAPGWKTYWRVPGDSGVPPTFDWSGSSNLAAAEVRWPAPVRFEDAFGHNIGYKRRVVFPVTVTPENPDRPVRLALTLDYAACREVCVPARAELAVTLGDGPADPAQQALVERFAETVPKPPDQVTGLAVTEVAMAANGTDTGLVIGVESDAQDAPVEILVEGDSTLYFGLPRQIDRTGDENGAAALYLVPVEGLSNPDELSGQTVRITVLQGGNRLAESRQVD